jgi:hypothetical protein
VENLGGAVGSSDSSFVCVSSAFQAVNTCAADFPVGRVIDLEARVLPASDSRFVGWQGDCASFGAQAQIRLTMNRDYSCRAVFARNTPPPPPAGQYQLSVTVERAGAFVGSTDGSFSCQGTATQPINTCVVSYPAGRVINLYAAPLPGSRVLFETWLDGCAAFAGQPQIQLTMNRDYNCRAAFVSAP